MPRRRTRSSSQRPLPSTPPASVETPVAAAGPSTAWALTGALAATAMLAGGASPLFGQDAARRPAEAARATRRFDIPAGPLGDAIAAYSRASGVAVVDPGALVGGLRSPGVSGTLADDDALRALLAGTGVAYRFTSGRAARLERATTLSAVTVTEARPRELQSSKYTAPLRDLPQTVSVVSQEVLTQQGVTSLRDALRNVAGLTVNAGEGGVTPGDNFNVRGFSARGDIFIDGVRDVGGYSRETFNVEQVEVAKGPGSAYVGRGSTGGTINLVTKTPLAERRWAGSAAVGSADFGRATADVNHPLGGRAAVRVNAAWQDGGVPGLDVVRNRNWGVAPSLALGLGTATRLTAQYYQAEQDNIPSYGITSFDSIPSVDTRHFFGLTSLDKEDTRARQATLRVEHDVSPVLSLRNQLAWGDRDVDRIVTFANLNRSRSSRSHVTHDANLTNQTTANAAFATGAVRHTLAAGLDLARERSQFGGYTITGAAPTIGDLNAPNPDDPYTGRVSRRRPTRDATSTTAGVYAFETARFGERFELTGGLRWDHFRAEYQDSLGKALDPAGTTTRAVTWRAGAVFKPTRLGSVYAAYGTSFNPSGELLALDGRGNAALDPERNRSVELGTKWELPRANLLLSAAGFRTEKTNARMTNPADPSGPQILAGEQRVDGVELGASGRVTAAWTVTGGYTWMQSEIVAGAAADVGNQLPNVPKHSASLWTAYTFPRRVEVGVGGRYVGERYVRGAFSVPSYRAFDASAAVPITRVVTVRLNVYNLTDETYYDNGRFWVPAPGRAVRLTSDVTF